MSFSYFFYGYKYSSLLFVLTQLGWIFQKKLPVLAYIGHYAVIVTIFLGLAGVITGFFYVFVGIKLKCPFCNRYGRLGHDRMYGTSLECDQCGIVYGSGFLRLRLVRGEMIRATKSIMDWGLVKKLVKEENPQLNVLYGLNSLVGIVYFFLGLNVGLTCLSIVMGTVLTHIILRSLRSGLVRGRNYIVFEYRPYTFLWQVLMMLVCHFFVTFFPWRMPYSIDFYYEKIWISFLVDHRNTSRIF